MSDTAAAVSVPPATAASSADPACDVAHGKADVPASTRTLVAVFASPVARFLLSYARDAGYRPVLLEPGGGPAPDDGPAPDGLTTVSSLAGLADEATDVVVCDHHRPELGPVLRDALASPASEETVVSPSGAGPSSGAGPPLGSSSTGRYPASLA